MNPKLHIRNGFEYHCIKFSVLDGSGFAVAWYFRPVGEKYWQHHVLRLDQRTGRSMRVVKATMEALCADPVKAAKTYWCVFARLADAAGAEGALSRAHALHEQVNQPDFDPGGSANNPERVSREMHNANGSGERIKSAQSDLAKAREMTEYLASK